ncbi:MAG: hypothetical protein ACJAXJ_000680 [Colwellia sp.]|jgi:hypothetical protein
MSLKIKVVTVAIILLVTTVVIMQNNETNENKQLDSGVKTNGKFSSIESIAKPNWWIKPTVSSTTTKPSTKSVKSNAEPISNFLIMPEMDGWQLQKNKTGIASATFKFNGKDNKNNLYELAIIRMNGQVTLEAVLSIWQSKAGLTPDSSPKATTLVTKQKQNLELFTFQGDKQTILVAVHKAEKYTFFRLSSPHKNNQESDQIVNKQMELKFNDLLADVYIYSK